MKRHPRAAPSADRREIRDEIGPSLLGLIEQRLDARRRHVEAIAAIDDELAQVGLRLEASQTSSLGTGDWPARPVVPPASVASPGSAPAAAPSVPPAGPLRAKHLRALPHANAECCADVTRALAKEPKCCAALCANVSWSYPTVAAALKRLAAQGLVRQEGNGNGRQWSLTEDAPIRASAPREDEQLETVWTPHRDAPSLLGDRVQKPGQVSA